MKQETTIEEAAKEFVLSHDFSQLTNPNHLANRCFQYGAKWQQEQDKNKYSKEDMELAFIAGGNSNITEDDGYGSRYIKYMDKWFEQYKKK
jgi:hypothetical protein